MTLVVEKTPIEGLLVIRPKVFRDPRGFFTESYNRASYQAAGIATDFVQDNHSRSCQGTLRGLHYQTKPGQVKLVRCTLGKVWDVAVDIRPGSPTLGKHFGLELGPEEMTMLYIPIGFAHGFVALTEWADVQYKMSTVYDGPAEAGIMWNDADLSVPWPLNGIKPVLSDRDQKHPTFREYRLNL